MDRESYPLLSHVNEKGHSNVPLGARSELPDQFLGGSNLGRQENLDLPYVRDRSMLVRASIHELTQYIGANSIEHPRKLRHIPTYALTGVFWVWS